MERTDEQQIEHDIGKRRDDQIIERPLAVAESVHDALAHIVHDDGQDANEVIPEVCDRVRQNLRRGAHPAQERRRQPHAHHRQNHAADQAQHHVRMDGSGHAVIVTRAEIAGNGHTCTHGEAGKKADEQKDQRAGRTDSRQRLIPQKPADDQCVRRIVKLLEHLTEKYRHGKLYDQLPCASLCHIQRISAHSAPFPSRKKYRGYSAICNRISETSRKCKPVFSVCCPALTAKQLPPPHLPAGW